jgi:hypothetical protein
LLILIVSIALLVLASMVGTSVLLAGRLPNFGFNASSDSVAVGALSPAWPIGGLTILGVVASLAVNILRAQRQDVPLDFKAFFRAMLYPQTFIAFCVSPVVFFGALLALGGKDLGPSVYLAAFQNGFFWQRILDAKKEQSGP